VQSEGPRPATPDELVGIAEIRSMLGVASARAYVISRFRDFPAPWYVSGDGRTRLWLLSEVEGWLDRYRPGWRDTTGS
jgi:predicted DNA-binding transcriptional regulator AlpA